jgi:hypothetical protein
MSEDENSLERIQPLLSRFSFPRTVTADSASMRIHHVKISVDIVSL